MFRVISLMTRVSFWVLYLVIKNLLTIKIGLFLASVIRPSQCPKFLRRDRSEKLAMLLSLVKRIRMLENVSFNTSE